MRSRSFVAVATLALSLSGCKGLKEALTAHVDVVAKAGQQELTVNRLGELMGKSRLQIPVTAQNAQTIAQFWVDYHLLGMAAARGDTLGDDKILDEAGYGLLAGMRLQRYMQTVAQGFKADSGSEAAYNRGAGDLFAARHILFGTTPVMTPVQRDSVRRLAEQVRAQVTTENFAQMAGRYSTEPGAGERGGSLGIFQKGQMVPPFANAVAALQPGQISGLVQTDFGYHIVQRIPYEPVKEQFDQAYAQASRQAAESTYFARLEQQANVQVKSDAPGKVKDALKDQAEHRGDKTVLASFNGGELTVARMLQWIDGAPQGAQIAQQIRGVPDSSVIDFVKAVSRNELLLREADKAGVKLTPEERTKFYADFRRFLREMWTELGVAPASLADSAKTPAERERLAAARVEAYLDRLVNGEAQPVAVPPIVSGVLAQRFDSKINQAGIERAVERGNEVRLASDSARGTGPATQVPIPGAGPQGAPPQQQPGSQVPLPGQAPQGAGQPAPAHP